MLSDVPRRFVVIGIVVALVAATFLAFRTTTSTRTVTAHFERTVSLYPGSEVRIMGVRVGSVKSVTPEGDSVRVVMEYDDQYKVPADAKAAIVTPTLVADRYVQLAPVYTGGEVMKDDADIPLPETANPVELDRIYQSLLDLTTALGPTGANKNGALDDLLSAGNRALNGNGTAGGETIRELSSAVSAFGDNTGPLFGSVRNMAGFTEELAANDRLVRRFMGDLASVSSSLAADRGELRAAVEALARAVGIVRAFVRDNRGRVTEDVRLLTRVAKQLARRSDELNDVARLGALGAGNLANGFDSNSGTEGARVQFGPTAKSLGNIMCDIVVNSKVPNPQQSCDLLKAITAPLYNQRGAFVGAGRTPVQLELGGTKPPGSVAELLDALRQGQGGA